MASNNLSLVSLNTCRMDNVAGIHQLLHNIDIYMFQEVCMTKEMLEYRFPGYNVWLSSGEGQLGIAFCVKKSITQVNVEQIIPGQIQKLVLTNRLKILHVYAPAGTNMAAERRALFSGPLLASMDKSAMLLAGDFNSVISEQDVEANFKNKLSREMRDIV